MVFSAPLILFLLSYTFSLQTISTGVFFYRERKERLKYFLFYSISVSIFLFFYSFVYLADQVRFVTLFYRLSALGWVTIPLTCLLFFLSLTNRYQEGLSPRHIFLLSFPTLSIMPFIFTGNFLATDFEKVQGLWLERVDASPILIIYYIAVITFYVLYALYHCRKEWIQKDNLKKGRLLKLLILPLLAIILLVLLFAIMIPRMTDRFYLPLSHLVIALYYIYVVVLLFINRLDLSKVNRILKSVFKDESLAVFYLSPKGRITKVIFQSQDFLNWNEKDLLNSPIHEFMDFRTNQQNFQDKWLKASLRKKETAMIDKAGKSVPISLTISEQYTSFDDFQGYIFIAKDNRQLSHLKDDIKRLSGSNTQLRDLSIKDTLTGIYNRAKFLASLEREEMQVQRYSSRSSLIMFDIDHFKNVNDTYGHDVGDIVLKSVVDSVAAGLREGDLFARWGGEEFIILSRNTHLDQALHLAERLRQRVENIRMENVPQVTASFGVSQFRKEDDQDKLLKRVDEHLYAAKNQGRNQVVGDAPSDDN